MTPEALTVVKFWGCVFAAAILLGCLVGTLLSSFGKGGEP